MNKKRQETVPAIKICS